MTHPQFEIIKKTLEASGIHKTEAVKLFGNITRQTLLNWENGKTPRVRFMFDNAIRVCGRIQAAVDKGYLPLDAGIHKPKERMKGIVLAIKRAGEEG